MMRARQKSLLSLSLRKCRPASRQLMPLACVLGSLALAGCSGSQQSEPEWPKQPSPSYPSSPGETTAQDAPLPDSESTAPKSSQQSSTDSQLAKKYDGKKAITTLKGKASYYADSLAGNHTANGDIYDPQKFTAAHKKLAFGTIVRVVRIDNGETTYVRINDRGPFGSADRIIDLSKAAAKDLEMMKAGVVAVRVEVVETPAK